MLGTCKGGGGGNRGEVEFDAPVCCLYTELDIDALSGCCRGRLVVLGVGLARNGSPAPVPIVVAGEAGRSL